MIHDKDLKREILVCGERIVRYTGFITACIILSKAALMSAGAETDW